VGDKQFPFHESTVREGGGGGGGVGREQEKEHESQDFGVKTLVLLV